MRSPHLLLDDTPDLTGGRMILAFSGWMDGGDVSTGTVQILIEAFDSARIGSIRAEPFYIYNFPGAMEVSALFRPHAKIVQGEIVEYSPPTNEFWAAPEQGLALFLGKEPNIHWDEFADAMFEAAHAMQTKSIYFVGSVAGMVPHSREPRLYAAVSDPALKAGLQAYGVHFADYEGPSSFVTYMMRHARHRGFEMVSLIAEVPAYIEGPNPKSMQAVGKRLAKMFELPVNFDELRATSDQWEAKLTAALAEKPDLAEHIKQLEADYDDAVFDTQMGDLKSWLREKGVRLD